MEEQEKYITANEAREMMKISASKMAGMLKSGELPSIQGRRDKRKKLIPLSAIRKWLEDAAMETPAA